MDGLLGGVAEMGTNEPGPPTIDGDVVLNPVSGTGDHVSRVRECARARDLAVHETSESGHGVDLAHDVAEDGAETVVAAGGDGTVNEVVRGVREAGALDNVTVCVVPCGTGNDFAANVGIEGIDDAFDVIDRNERRWIDLGVANDRPFVNSCIGGITAEASAGTDPDLKDRFGTVAYVIETLRTLSSFDGIRLSVDLFDEEGHFPAYSGSAVAVFVGNCRRFAPGGTTQANVEDERFEVTLVHDAGDSISLASTAAVEWLFGRDSDRTSRFSAPTVHLDIQDGDPVDFSLDGEMLTDTHLALHTRPRALRVAVGESYEPVPDYPGGT
jgi:YegS/Rv2252/BmrU family lipid kinase